MSTSDLYVYGAFYTVVDQPVVDLPTTTSTGAYSQYNIGIVGDTLRIRSQRVPASASDTGAVGEFCFGVDSGVTYLYYCDAANSWKRVALSSW